MPSTISPNMSLIIPTVGEEQSPTWAQDLNNSLSILDQHNHSSGNGNPIEPSGMNIVSELPFQNNDITGLRSANFQVQASPLALPGDLGCLYVSGVDLYYNDENGIQIRITASGGVAGTPGSIGSLAPPASVTYVSATPAYVFQSDVSTSADIDGGSLVIRENIANAKGVTLSSPAALSNDYALVFPAALPGSTKIMRLDSSGNISSNLGVDGSTIVISSDNITLGTIPNSTITTAMIQNNAVTKDKAAAPVFNTSVSSGAFSTASAGGVMISGLTVTLTPVRNPIMIGIVPDGNATNDSVINGGSGLTWRIYLQRNGTTMAIWSGVGSQQAPGFVCDFAVTGGVSYTYIAYVELLSATSITASYIRLAAYEI